MFALWGRYIFCVCQALYLSLLSWMQLAGFLVIQFYSCGKLSSAHKLSPRRSYSQPRCAVLWAWELAGCLSSVQLSLWCDAPSLPCSSWQADDPGQCSGPSPGWCALWPVEGHEYLSPAAQQARGGGCGRKCWLWCDHTDHKSGSDWLVAFKKNVALKNPFYFRIGLGLLENCDKSVVSFHRPPPSPIVRSIISTVHLDCRY